MTQISTQKETLRNKFLKLRSQIDPKTKRGYDELICTKLIAIAKELDPKVIHAYIPIKDEINIIPFLDYCLKKDITVICPKVLPKRQLANLELKSLKTLEKGPFNTLHPSGNLVYKDNIDLIIMPGLAFDKNLNRLGYGGGYYDRFVAENSTAQKIAVLYPMQFIDQVPVENHDQKVDKLILP